MITTTEYVSDDDGPIFARDQEVRSTVYFKGSFEEFVEKMAEEGFVLKQNRNAGLYYFRGYAPTLKSFWIMAIEKDDGLSLNTSVKTLSHLLARNILA